LILIRRRVDCEDGGGKRGRVEGRKDGSGCRRRARKRAEPTRPPFFRIYIFPSVENYEGK